MSAVRQAPGRARRETLLFVLVAVGFVVAVVVALAAYDRRRDTREARRKADELIELWAHEGLPVPEDTDLLVPVLGTDGGALCQQTGEDLLRGFRRLELANGAAGPGQRPVIADERTLVTGARSVVEVYCPDRLDEFDDFVDDLDLDDVVRD